MTKNSAMTTAPRGGLKLASALRRLILASIAACTFAAPLAALAQGSYPERPIRMVIPWAPGGETDIFARSLAPRLSEVLGQPVVIENRPGATGIVASEFVARARPDGYTLIFGTAATHALNLSVFKSLSYHPLKDFQTVAFVGTVPLVLLAHSSMPENLKDFITLLKDNPGKYTYGAAGASTTHLGVELFKSAASVDALHVPYQGTGPALQDLAAGRIHFMGSSIGAAQAILDTGRVHALTVLNADRLAGAASIPTAAEAGIPLEVGTWNVVLAPSGTPAPIVETLNRAINEVLREPAVRERLASLGIEPVSDSTPESTAERMAAEIDKFASAFKLSGAQQQ